MILNLNQTSRNYNSKLGIGVFEIMLSIALLAGFVTLVMGLIREQAKGRRVAETRVSMELIHSRAQQAVRRFLSFEMDSYLNLNPSLKSCFDAKGTDCENFSNLSFPAFSGAVAGSRDAELNTMMNGQYNLAGVLCAGTSCPIQVATNWELMCQGMSCTEAKINTIVNLDTNNLSSEDKQLLSNFPKLNSENIYNKTKRVGLVRTLAASCDVPTTANLTTQVMDCVGVSANNDNELFDTNLGSNYLNGDIQLVAGGTTGSTTGLPPPPPPPTTTTTTGGTTTGSENCPACTHAVMTDDGLECVSNVICTNPGWVVRGCRCGIPAVPGGGNGWGPWSACTQSCGNSGIQTRSCLYPIEDGYLDSVCSRNDPPQTQACNRTPCTCSNGATNWPACSSCPGGSCMKWTSQSNHALKCKRNDEENDNGKSGNGNFTHTYTMGSWDQTEYAGCRNCKNCSISVNRRGGYHGGSGDSDKVTVKCNGQYRFQLRRNRCG